jgi:hypothetical protein
MPFHAWNGHGNLVIKISLRPLVLMQTSERGVYGLAQIFTLLSTYDLVVFYAHSVAAEAHQILFGKKLNVFLAFRSFFLSFYKQLVTKQTNQIRISFTY